MFRTIRPIAKFYRCWLQDIENGVTLDRCRGIDHDQFKTADRISINYERIFKGSNSPCIKLPQKKSVNIKALPLETQVQIMHEYNSIFKKLGSSSARIIEHIVISELPLRQYELKQVPRWAKGAGIARLREALTELMEIYRMQK